MEIIPFSSMPIPLPENWLIPIYFRLLPFNLIRVLRRLALAERKRPARGAYKTKTGAASPFEIVDLGTLPGAPCPCGVARRGFLSSAVASVHRVDISADAKAHYHKSHTEIYYFLECGREAKMELNGKLFPVKAGMAVMVRPGTPHRAVGKMKILNLVVPPFDKGDEWLD
jgi:mannose-6-phosphate isomerase-like protein (cupin superfamily)